MKYKLLVTLFVQIALLASSAAVSAGAPGHNYSTHSLLGAGNANSQAGLAASLPADFSVSEIAHGLIKPYEMEFAPDGRLFISQQGGKLRVIKNGTLLAQPFLSVAVDARGDRGLIGIAFDPNFAANQYVYVFYTTPTPVPHHRVSRFTGNGDVAVPGSEHILIELDNLDVNVLHNGGAVHFGLDGKLYISTGNNVVNANSQSLSTLLGKILRINSDGSIPTDNPFYATASGKNRAIWALGLRNPYTFAIQPGTGRIFINDVGAKSWEEINDGVAGANYGWPVTEGVASNPQYVDPIYAYAHGATDTTGCAIAGGTFYNPPIQQFPAEYAGSYFFADHCNNWIRKLDPAHGNAVSAFMTNIIGPVDLKTGPDGSLYVLARSDASSGQVYQIRYGEQGPPRIAEQPSNQTIAAGDSATFSVSAAGDAPLTYQWQRDGAAIPGATGSSYTVARATLADNGANFRCVVSNRAGSVTSESATLSVLSDQRPTGTITQPAAGLLYRAGDTIIFAGTATDPEQGTLPPSAFSWEIVFHHNTHTHSFLGPFQGISGGTFVIPQVGETDDDVWYRIHLTVTDAQGLQHTSYSDVLPRKAKITLHTEPAGLQVTFDDQPVTTPYSTISVVGMQRTVASSAPTVNGVPYGLAVWSDGGASAHSFYTADADTTYTATFYPARAWLTIIDRSGK